jgi:hypothetical protein
MVRAILFVTAPIAKLFDTIIYIIGGTLQKE